nr:MULTISPECIES: hypothetical protein [Myxococcaceae]
MGLALGVLPLWVGAHLPMVDLPQHLHLISALHRLDDPTTLYPQLLTTRGELTPYLGYYYAVSALNWVLPLELANRLFLSLYVAGLPLALAFLLRALGRPRWPSLLALPFAYGDSFGWGFVNYLAALPLALLCAGLFVRSVTDAARRRAWAVGMGLALVVVLLFHVQAFAFLALALPWLLLTTRTPAGERWWPARVPALVGVVPGVLLFLLWVGLRLGAPAEVEPGVPWKAWGPMLSPQNLAYKPFAQNLDELPRVLGNLLRDGSDRLPVWAVGAVALLALGAWAVESARRGTGAPREGALEAARPLGLLAIALALYFLLPFDIRGYMYYLNTRFAHLAAALAVAALPAVHSRGLRRALLGLAAGCALLLALVLGTGFLRFSREASELDALVAATAPRPRVMGLVYDWSSREVRFPVYLHAAAVLARARGGVANFSFALTPHSPLKYRGVPPPTFPSEWHPEAFVPEREGAAYDHFLVRGVHPSRVFGERLVGGDLVIAAHAGQSWLVRRR